ncbi:MAG: aldose 1-epimerase family protein [Fuerstiella sp.]|nr:aldose 1-epimerase family protein [Fuerstiella sp.]
MTVYTVTLLDVGEGIYADDAVIDTDSSNGRLADHDWSVSLNRMHGGLSDGIDLVQLNNGHLQLYVLPTRGMGVWKGKCGLLPLQWNSPVTTPVHPSFVDQSRSGGIGWLDGFNELICRCGLGWHGAPGTDTQYDEHGTVVCEQLLTLHGRIANIPAHRVSVEVDTDGLISIIGVVDETSVFGDRLRLTSVLSTQAGSSQFSIRDTVTNLGGTPAEVELLYHCNFGTPLLGEGASVHVAASRVTPRDSRASEGIDRWATFRGATPGFEEQVYFVSPLSDDSGRALVVLRNPDGHASLALRFDTSTLPCFTLWKNTQAVEDGYCCGLEPGSSLPNNRGFEREMGRVRTLQPGNSIEFSLQCEVAESQDQTQHFIDEVVQLQKNFDCHTEMMPVADLSPT